MGQQHRLQRSVGYKLAVWILGLFLAWQFLITANVAEAILYFCFGGELPGTTMVLSPDAVIWLVAGILTFGILFFTVRAIVRTVQVRKHMRTLGVVEAQTLKATKTTLKATKTTKTLESLPTAPLLPGLLWRHRALRQVHDWLRSGKNFSRRLLTTLKPYLKSMIAYARRGLHWLRDVASITYRRSSRLLQTTARGTRRVSLMAWQWLAPYLWQLDGWLGKQVARFENWLQRQLVSDDSLRHFIALGHQYLHHTKQALIEVMRHAKKIIMTYTTKH